MKTILRRMQSSPFLIVLLFFLSLSIGLFQNCGGSFASLTHTSPVNSGNSLAIGNGHAPAIHNQANAVTSAAWNSADSVFIHNIGAANGNSWAVSSNSPPGFLTFGPYSNAFQPGVYVAKFSLAVDNNSADDMTIGYVDVFDNLNNITLGHRDFHRREFASPNSSQDFDLTFSVPASNDLEFRVFYYGFSYLVHSATSVTQAQSYNRVTFVADDAGSYHQIGNATGTGSWAATSQMGAGVLTYGPYSQQFKAGTYLATFDLAVDNNSDDDLTVASIDVNEPGSLNVIASRKLTREDFATAQTRQSFELPFSYDGIGALEFRVQVAGNSFVEHFGTNVQANPVTEYRATDASMGHLVGAIDGAGWSSGTSQGQGYLSLGPYTYAAPVGGNTVSFSLTVDNNSADNGQIGRLDVYDTKAQTVLAERTIFRKNFEKTDTPQDFDLVFEQLQNKQLEFRVFTNGISKLTHFTTTLHPDRLTMNELWNQKAHFEIRKRDSFLFNTLGDSSTSSLVVLDGKWYAFNRQAVPTPTACNAIGALQVVVRESRDRGVSWSDPVVVAAPTGGDGSGFEGCMIVDGGAFYDQDNDTWHYLGQCIGVGTGWDLCHYTKNGSSPMGLFARDSHNPVVRGGQLWANICKGEGKSCPTNMVDEGTPQIIGKRSGYYYVTFHGAAYDKVVYGARGIARTTDFVHWESSGADLPGDAIHSKTDCNKWDIAWQDGCIGIGAARLLRSGGYNYSLAEAADKTLICQVNQNWVVGLMRSKTYSASGAWENYLGNPLITNLTTSPVGCALQYMSLFRDRGETYLTVGVYVPEYGWPNYTYQLTDSPPTAPSMKVK